MTGVHRDRGMAAGVTRHGDQDETGVDGVEGLGGAESSPRLASGAVLDEVGAVRPLLSAIANFLASRRGMHRPERFGGGDMDLGVREIGQTADVIEVEVGDDDVPDVVTVESEFLDLVSGGLAAQQPGATEVPE